VLNPSELCSAADERHVLLVWGGPERSDCGEQAETELANFRYRSTSRHALVGCFRLIRESPQAAAGLTEDKI